MKEKEFDLSEKIIKRDTYLYHGLPFEDVKEFIRRLKGYGTKQREKLKFEDERFRQGTFNGIGLMMCELDKLAGEKLK